MTATLNVYTDRVNLNLVAASIPLWYRKTLKTRLSSDGRYYTGQMLLEAKGDASRDDVQEWIDQAKAILPYPGDGDLIYTEFVTFNKGANIAIFLSFTVENDLTFVLGCSTMSVSDHSQVTDTQTMTAPLIPTILPHDIQVRPIDTLGQGLQVAVWYSMSTSPEAAYAHFSITDFAIDQVRALIASYEEIARTFDPFEEQPAFGCYDYVVGEFSAWVIQSVTHQPLHRLPDTFWRTTLPHLNTSAAEARQIAKVLREMLDHMMRVLY